MIDLEANEESNPLKDFDEDLELRDDVVESLKTYLASDGRGDDADEVFHTLGL